MTVGTGWLLTSRQILPGVNWVWVLALGVLGLATLASGVNKFTFVIGPFLVLCSIAALLRQSGRLKIDTEIPALTIVLGALMLVARLAPIPWPKWMDEDIVGRRREPPR